MYIMCETFGLAYYMHPIMSIVAEQLAGIAATTSRGPTGLAATASRGPTGPLVTSPVFLVLGGALVIGV
jgi:hypothetical protein